MLLLRHASAGERLSSPSADRARRLDSAGRAVARRLPSALADYALERVVTSPHVRCVETAALIADARGLAIELCEDLAPDASRADTLRLLGRLPDSALVCTHREVIDRLFAGKVTCEKGGAWLVERRGRRWLPVEYVAPPARATRARRRTALV